MDDARGLALDGAAHGTAVLAERQTRGRGRLGRVFVSPPGGMYLSVVLKPDELSFNTPTAVTAYIGLCVCEAISAVFGIEAGIKWVNDIMVNGKKVGGILVEAPAGIAGVSAYIAGIGVNVYTRDEDFPEEVKWRAASLSPGDGRGSALIDKLAVEIINQVLNTRISGEKDLFEMYRQKLTVLGRRVTVTQNGASFDALARGIDQTGRLIVVRDDGTEDALLYGDVSVKASV